MAIIKYPLPFTENLQDNVSCKTTFPVQRTKGLNEYTQSYAKGLSHVKEYSLSYGCLLDEDSADFFPNVVTVENLFSIQETDSFISWVPPSESIKQITLETGTINGHDYSIYVGGNGTTFTSLTAGDWLFLSETEIINPITLEELTTDTFVGVINSINSDTQLVLTTLGKEFAGKTFKVVSPMLFYMPTKWTKIRKSVYIAGEKIFHTSIGFSLLSVY